MRLLDALAQSLNRATVRVGMQVKPERLADLIHTLAGIQASSNPSLILGAVDESPYAMAQLYQFLASGGEIQPLHAVRGVLDRNGKAVNRYDKPPAPAQQGDAIAARIVTSALQYAVTSGTGHQLVADGLGRLKPAGKTGTSNDSRDSWFAGWTGDHLAVIWVGNDQNQPTGLYGATGAMRVWSASSRPAERAVGGVEQGHRLAVGFRFAHHRRRLPGRAADSLRRRVRARVRGLRVRAAGTRGDRPERSERATRGFGQAVRDGIRQIFGLGDPAKAFPAAATATAGAGAAVRALIACTSRCGCRATWREQSIEALSEGGALARALPQFRAREAQQRLTGAVADAFESREVLLAEAGTGTGKTYAYLVPALLSGMKTILHRHARAAGPALPPRPAAGARRARRRPEKRAAEGPRELPVPLPHRTGERRSAHRARHAGRIVPAHPRLGRAHAHGRPGRVEALPDDSPLLPLVTSTADNCLGTECPFWNDCFVVQARQRAQAADIVVVNHHLLLADLALKQEGFGEILPGAQAFVVDEAHQLPELAAQFFGEGIGARPLVELVRDALAECKGVPGALAALQAPARDLEQAVRALRAALEPLPPRATQARALADPDASDAFDGLASSLQVLHGALAPWRDSAPGLDACHARAQEFCSRLARWRIEERGSESLSGTMLSDIGMSRMKVTLTPFPSTTTCAGTRRRRAVSACNARRWMCPAAARASRAFARGLGVHLGDAGGGRRFRARRHPARARRAGNPAAAKPVRLECAGAVLSPAEPAATIRARLHLRDARRRAAGAGGLERARVPAVRLAPCVAGGGAGAARRAVAVVRAGRGAAPRAAAAVPRIGQWRAARRGEFPRGRGRGRRRAHGGGDRQAAFAAPDDPVFEARLEAIRRAGGNPFSTNSCRRR